MGASVVKIDMKNIKFHERIGEGGFGTVKRVSFKKPYKGYKEAAAKSVLFDLGKREVEIMSRLQHPNIVTMLGICQTGHSDLILMEYAPNGSLHDYLKDPTKPLPFELQKRWAKESAFAIQYLHQQNYLHRDIKPQNCLLFEDNSLKLCDFGLARETEESQTTSSQKGTYRYMAPEILVGNDNGRGIYSKPSDIWSYGMLLLEICTRKPPFEDLEWHRVVFEVGGGAKPPIPGDCPKDVSDIMQRCWKADPKDRMPIGDIIIALDGKQEIYPDHNGKQLTVARIASCLNGDVIISSLDDNGVYLLTGDGKSKAQLTSNDIDSKTQIGSVRSVCVSPFGLIQVVDHTSFAKVFTQKGKYQQCLDTMLLNEVRSAPHVRCGTMDRQGDLLVANSLENDINIVAQTFPYGKLVRRIKCRRNGSIGLHPSMVVNSKSQILIHHDQTDFSGCSEIVAIDYSGNEVFSFTPKIDVGDGDYVEGAQSLPGGRAGGIVCDENDNIYVVMRISSKDNTGHVHAYSPTGEFLQCMAKGLYKPTDLSMTSDGRLVIANTRSITVLKPLINATSSVKQSDG